MKKLLIIIMLAIFCLGSNPTITAHGYVLGSTSNELKSRVQFTPRNELGGCPQCVN